MTTPSWPRVRLAELTIKVGSGATPKGGEAVYKARGVPLIRSMNVVFFGFKREGIAYLDDAQAEALRSVEVQKGDVLLNITGASIGRVTIAPDDMDGARVNQHVCIIRPTEAIDRRFLSAFLSSPAMQDMITAENYGVTRQALTKQQILDFQIPVPGLTEQRRIADKLDTLLARVDACRERLDRVPGILKRFRQAVLAAATSGELTREWREERSISWSWLPVTIEDIAEVGTGSTPLRSNNHFYAPTGVPWITSAATGLPYVTSATEFVTESAIAAHRLKLYPVGTLLIAMYGEGKTRGQVTELKIEATINQACAAVIVDSTKALAEFVRLSLESNYLQMRDLAEGGAQPNLNLSKIKQFRLMLPDMDEQEAVVERATQLLRVARIVQSRSDHARLQVVRLMPELLARAFRGELVPQDPNDEPASELLARLQAFTTQPPATRLNRRTTAPRERKPSKEPGSMSKTRNDEDVRNKAYLARHLRTLGGKATAEQLYKESELGLADFYKQLSWEVDRGHIRDLGQQLGTT